MIYLLDANALHDYLVDAPRMSERVRDIIDDPGQGNLLAIPTIVLVELWDLSRKNRRNPVDFSDVEQAVRRRATLVEDLTRQVVGLLPNLWEDSRDMIILATALDIQARYGEVTIISRDRAMRFNQCIIPCIW